MTDTEDPISPLPKLTAIGTLSPSILHTVVADAVNKVSTTTEIDARENWNARTEAERVKSRKNADRWDSPLTVHVARTLFDRLGPELTAIWKQEVPCEEETSHTLKANNIEIQAKVNAEHAARTTKNEPQTPHGTYIVRYEFGKEVECYHVEHQPKLSFWAKVKSFFKRGQL